MRVTGVRDLCKEVPVLPMRWEEVTCHVFQGLQVGCNPQWHAHTGRLAYFLFVLFPYIPSAGSLLMKSQHKMVWGPVYTKPHNFIRKKSTWDSFNFATFWSCYFEIISKCSLCTYLQSNDFHIQLHTTLGTWQVQQDFVENQSVYSRA